MLAFCGAALAVTALVSRKTILSILLSVASLFFTGLSGYNWRLALVDSGKNPAWLGVQSYPAAFTILLLLASISLACLIGGAILIEKRKHQT